MVYAQLYIDVTCSLIYEDGTHFSVIYLYQLVRNQSFRNLTIIEVQRSIYCKKNNWVLNVVPLIFSPRSGTCNVVLHAPARVSQRSHAPITYLRVQTANGLTWADSNKSLNDMINGFAFIFDNFSPCSTLLKLVHSIINERKKICNILLSFRTHFFTLLLSVYKAKQIKMRYSPMKNLGSTIITSSFSAFTDHLVINMNKLQN